MVLPIRNTLLPYDETNTMRYFNEFQFYREHRNFSSGDLTEFGHNKCIPTRPAVNNIAPGGSNGYYGYIPHISKVEQPSNNNNNNNNNNHDSISMAHESLNEKPVETHMCSAEMNARKRLIETEPVFEATAKRQRTGNYDGDILSQMECDDEMTCVDVDATVKNVIFLKHSYLFRHLVEEKQPTLSNLRQSQAKNSVTCESGPLTGNKLLTNVIFHTANGCEDVEELLFKTHGACFSNIFCGIDDY